MFDTHAHLNHEQFQADRYEVIERARSAGVTGLVNVGYDLGSSRLAVEMASEEDDIYAAVGVHPHEAETVSRETVARLRELARKPGVVAIGETGLDFFRDLSPRQAQIDAFRWQIDIAAAEYLTLIVHTRNAHDEVMEILERQAPPHLRVVLHCFSGDQDMADEAIRRGYWIGLAGNITYPNAHALRAVAARVPDEKLLIETDCPYLPPQGRRGRRNEPAYLRETLEALAAVRMQHVEEVERLTDRNALAAFGLAALE
ncbi:MAG: TatD family hydrolase [Armatimonadetes bacterium]|nr:TatD family hydrolase [Armatimonadota bacterium]